jgi:ribose transport system substrate-binding protein
VAVVGFDATDEAVRAVADGRLAATIAQNPKAMGEKGVEAALAVIAGKPVEPRIDTGTELVTRTNATPYLK